MQLKEKWVPVVLWQVRAAGVGRDVGVEVHLSPWELDSLHRERSVLF